MVRRTLGTSRCQRRMEPTDEKRDTAAPLARMESYDDEEYDDGVIRVTMTIDDEDDIRSESHDTVHSLNYEEKNNKTAHSVKSTASLLRKYSSKKRQKTAVVNDDVYRKHSVELTSNTTLLSDSFKSPSAVKRNSILEVACLSQAIDHLIVSIEEHGGLSTEGIYRKSGAVSKVKKLQHKLQKTSNPSKDISSVDLDAYINDIHVLTSVLKSLLRNMHEPLLTNELTPEFIAASGIEDSELRANAIDNLIQRLPLSNQLLLNKLLDHLLRVTDNVSTNRMTPEALATVFAPNIMSSQSSNVSPYSSHVTEQSTLSTFQSEKQLVKCLQCIIESRMKQTFPESCTESNGHQMSPPDADQENENLLSNLTTQNSSMQSLDDATPRITTDDDEKQFLRSSLGCVVTPDIAEEHSAANCEVTDDLAPGCS